MVRKRELRAQRRRHKKRAQKKISAKHQKIIPVAPGPSCPSLDAGRPIVVVSENAQKQMVKLVEGNPELECGCMLIGNLCVDPVTGAAIAFVDDIYSDWDYGGGAEYEFKKGASFRCLKYAEKMYDEKKHMIGTAHSHGRFNAFFSNTDYRMMNRCGVAEFHFVISPGHREFVVCYKDKDWHYNYDIEVIVPDCFGYERKYLEEWGI